MRQVRVDSKAERLVRGDGEGKYALALILLGDRSTGPVSMIDQGKLPIRLFPESLTAPTNFPTGECAVELEHHKKRHRAAVDPSVGSESGGGLMVLFVRAPVEVVGDSIDGTNPGLRLVP